MDVALDDVHALGISPRSESSTRISTYEILQAYGAQQ
jgi:hypothetical protein